LYSGFCTAHADLGRWERFERGASGRHLDASQFRGIGEGSDTIQLGHRHFFEPPSIPAIQEFRIRVRIQPKQ
jgi:hypothetical protein